MPTGEQFFELPMSLYITQDKPIDGKRYVASSQTEQNSVITEYRAFVGLQVYRTDTKKLWVLESLEPGQAVHANTVWVEVGKTDSFDPTTMSFLDLKDTPVHPPGYVGFADRILTVNSTQDGIVFSTTKVSDIVLIADIVNILTSYNTEAALSANMGRELKERVDEKEPIIAVKGSAFNKDFLTSEVADGDETDPPGHSKAGTSEDVARSNHDHAGLYYKKSEVNSKIIAASQGIKGTWLTPVEMRAKITADDAEEGDMYVLDANLPAGPTPIIVGTEVDKALENRAVYKWNLVSTIWEFMYLMDAEHTHPYEDANTNIQEHVTLINENPHKSTSEQIKSHQSESYSPSIELGGYNTLDTVGKDDDVFFIIKKLLTPIIHPTIISNVSVRIDFSATPVGLRSEVGTAYSSIFASPLGYKNYNPGYIRNMDTPPTANTALKGGVKTAPDDVTYSQITGTSASVDAVTGLVSGNIAAGTQTFRAAVNYNTGTAPYYDSEGVSTLFDGGQRNEGTVNGDGSVYGSYYIFYGVMDEAAPSSSSTIRALTRIFYTKSVYSFTVAKGKKRVAVYTPPGIDPDKVQIWLTDSNAKVTPVPTTVQVVDGGGTSVTYNKFDQYIGEGGYLVDKTYEIRIV